MRRLKNRQRKIVANDQLVDLFRKGLAGEQALRRGKLTLDQDKAALAAIHAFHRAADVPLWERFSPLHPRATDAELQSALLAKLPPAELAAWKRYVARWQKERDAEIEHPPARRKQRKTADMPRSELRFAKSLGGW